MNQRISNQPTSWKTTVLLTLGAMALHAVASVFSGMVVGMSGVSPPRISGAGLGGMLAGTVMVCIGLVPLARILGGTRSQRFVALAAFLYVAHTVNTSIEAAVFMTAGGTAFMLLAGILPAVAVAALFCRFGRDEATSFSSAVGEHFATLQHHHVILRLVGAWLAFPLVYFVFGIMIAPIVMATYQTGVAGLVLPDGGTVLSTQLGRSALYLVTAIPILVLARGVTASRIVRLGVAYFALVGLAGLVGATFFPMLLRVTHSVEIGADSFAYASLLVLLLGRRAPVDAQTPVAA
jgi:hypothetical protein